MAKNYITGESKMIPVYISLCDLGNDSNSIINKICEIIGLDYAKVRSMLVEGDLVLLLDGYNEILDPSVQKSVAKAIDSYFRVYFKNTHIYMSDRTISRRSTPVLNDAIRLFLREIALKEKLDFFRLLTTEEVYQLIFEKTKNNPNYFKQLNTPYKLQLFLDIVENTHGIPDDITAAYIKRPESPA